MDSRIVVEILRDRPKSIGWGGPEHLEMFNKKKTTTWPPSPFDTRLTDPLQNEGWILHDPTPIKYGFFRCIIQGNHILCVWQKHKTPVTSREELNLAKYAKNDTSLSLTLQLLEASFAFCYYRRYHFQLPPEHSIYLPLTLRLILSCWQHSIHSQLCLC